MIKNKFDFRFLYLFIPLFITEVIFRFIQFTNFEIYSFLRMILFLLAFSVFVNTIITKFKSFKILFYSYLVIIIWFCIYCFVELIFKNYMGDYYSFGTVGDGLNRIAKYILIFISNAQLSYYLLLLPIIIYILIVFRIHFRNNNVILSSVIIIMIAVSSLIYIFNFNQGNESITYIYNTFSNKDTLIDKLGITHFFFRDISALKFKQNEKLIIEEVKNEDEIIETEEEAEKKRIIDDSKWKAIIQNEEDEDMKNIDTYLQSRNIDKPNEYTGIFENYNFIYILVESGDYLMIDKDLTPTLYSMYTNGLTFYNHYTPLYSCGTGESEFVSYTSIFPYTNCCTPNYLNDVYFYESLPFLFKNKGYTTLGFHNWRDEWYERNELLNHVGIDEYYDIDAIRQEDQSVKLKSGWQSDLMLAEQAWKHISEVNGNFFAMIISSTMHFPYDENSYYGDAYVEQVSEIHPEWSIDYKRYMSKCIEFDKSLEYLINQLKASGQLDNTVICMYPDHRPYWLDYDLVFDYTSWINKRDEFSNFGDSGLEKIGVYRSPFIIYNNKTDANVNYNYCSTMDHVPTIANLFNLDYDPRLYIGSDIYDGSNYVIFNNRDWINEYGIYDSSKEEFIPRNNSNINDETIDRMNSEVKNQINISHAILDENYFERRKDICYPKHD